MGLDVNALSNTVGLQSNIKINPYVARTGYSTRPDFTVKPDVIVRNPEITSYVNSEYLTDAIKRNPEIKNMLLQQGLPVKLNMRVMNDIQENHLPETKKIAAGIACNLPQPYKDAVNFQAIQEAAALHDIGKTLIPDSIVGKRGKLNEDEYQKMQMHSSLGYELLKDSQLSDDTKNLIRNHHQNPKQTGYPDVEENYVADVNSQILHAADVYSALREERVYKKALSKNEALAILHKEMKSGNIHPYVFKALVDYANEVEPAAESSAVAA